jgi:DNA-binding Lrp family transcriptional regulator
LDSEIITRLQIDGREANTDIARALEVSEGTVRKRIERLIADKVIQIGAWADPLKVGYQTYAFIQIKVAPGSVDEAAEALARLPDAAQVVGFGPLWDIVFATHDIKDHRTLLATDRDRHLRFHTALARHGVMVRIGGRSYFSTAHTETEIDETVRACRAALAEVIS